MRSGIPGRIAVLGCLVLTSASAQPPDDTPDPIVYSRIRDEGTARSHVMEYASELMDEIGPRLTGSPNLERAIDWAMRRLRDAGASNVAKESWGEFGMGWRQRNVWVRLTEPTPANIIAAAAPWSPPTRGPVSGIVVPVTIADDKAFERYRGNCATGSCCSDALPRRPPRRPSTNRSSSVLTRRNSRTWHVHPKRSRPRIRSFSSKVSPPASSPNASAASLPTRAFAR